MRRGEIGSGVRVARNPAGRRAPHAPFRIGICGSYGGLNQGDEAILDSIVRQLRARVDSHLLVFSRDREDTLRRHQVERAVDVRRLTRADLLAELGGLDLFVLGGGGILFDGEAGIFVRPLMAAHALRLSTMTWAVGAGPLRDREERLLVKAALDPVHLITVRDNHSRLLLEDIGLTQDIRVVPDPALLMDSEPFGPELLQREGIEPGVRLIGLSVREKGPAAPDLDSASYQELLANLVDYVTQRLDATVLFIPMEKFDRQLAHAIASRVRNVERVLLLKGDYSARQLGGLMSRLDLVIGMRLHVLVFAACAGVPFVAFPYGAKVTEFAQSLGMPTVPVTNAGQLLAAVDRAWDLRQGLQEALSKNVTETRALAASTADWAVKMLQSQRVPPSRAFPVRAALGQRRRHDS